MSESTLVLGVDSRQVDKGAKSLDELAEAGAKAEKAANAHSAQQDKLASYLSKSAREAQGQSEAVRKVAESHDAADLALGRYVGRLAGAAIAAELAMIKVTINFADKMNDLHLKTDLAFQSLAAYDQLARQSGTNIEAVAQSFKFLGRYMTEHADKLKSIGVTSKDTNVAMGQFADVIAGIQDSALRSTAAMTVLGRSGTEMIPMLMGGAAAFKEATESTKAYGEMLAKVAPEADKLNDKWEVFKTGAKTSALTLTNDLMPSMQKLIDYMVRMQAAHGTWKALLATIGAAMAQVVGYELDPQIRAQNEINEILKKRLALIAQIKEREAGGAETATLRQQVKELGDLVKAKNDDLHATQAAAGAHKESAAATDEAVRKMVAQKDAYIVIQKSAADYLKTLEKEATEIGMTTEQKALYEAQIKSLTLATQKERDAFMKNAEAWIINRQAAQELEDERKATQKVIEESGSTFAKELEAINKKIEASKWEEQTAGLTKEAIENLKAAREADTIAALIAEQSTLDSTEAGERRREQIELLVGALQKQVDQEKLTAKAVGAAKLAEDATKANEHMWKEYDRWGKQVFDAVFEKGQNVFKSLGDMIKKYVLDMLYKMTLQKWLINVGVIGGTVAAGSAMASTGSAMAGIGSGSSLAGAAGFLGEAGQAVGYYGATMMGASGATAASIGSMLGTAMPYIAAAVLLYSVGKGLFSGGETRAGGQYAVNAAGQAQFVQGPSGGQLAGEQVMKSVEGTNTNINKLLGAFGSSQTITGMTAYLESSANGKGGAYAAGTVGGQRLVANVTGAGETNWGQSLTGEQATGQLADDMARLTLMSLQAAKDIPPYLHKIFDALDPMKASPQLINDTIAYASTVKQVRDALTETRTPFEVLHANINKGFSELGTSADTFKTDFVAAIDAGISPENLAKWVSLGNLLDQDAELARKTASKHIELMQAQGRSFEALQAQRELDIKGMSAEDAAIQRRINAAQDAAKTQSLSIQLLSAEGYSYAALTANRELAIKGMSAEDAAIQRSINAAEDAAKTRGLEIQLLDAQGLAYDSLIAKRELDIKGMSAEDAAIQRSINAAEDAAKTQGLSIQLMESEGRSYEALAAKRELDIKGMSAEDAAIQRSINAAEDAAKSQNLNIQILELSGHHAESVAAQRQLELKGLSESDRVLQQRIYDLQDEAEATAKANSILSQRLSLEAQYASLTGDNTLSRIAELKTIDPSNRALQIRVWALQDEQAAAQNAAQSTKDVASAYADARKAQGDYLQGIVKFGASIRDFLRGLDTGEFAATPQAALSAAQQQYVADLAASRRGDADAQARLVQDSQTYLKNAQAVYGNGGQMSAILGQIKTDLGNLPEVTQYDANLAALKAIENAINAGVGSSGYVTQAVTTTIPFTLKESDLKLTNHLSTQFDRLDHDHSGGLTVDEFKHGLGGLASDATLTALFNLTDTNGDGIISAIEASAVTISDEIRRHLPGEPGYVPRFASGGDFIGGLRLVGENGPELEATGASRIFNASQTRGILAANDGSTSEAINALREELADTKATLARLLEQGNAIVKNQTATLGGTIVGEGERQRSALTNASLLREVA